MTPFAHNPRGIVACLGALALLLLVATAAEGQFGGFAAQVVYSSPAAPRCVAIGDLNNDGHNDLAVGGASADIKVHLNNGNGTFAASTAYSVGGAVPHANSVALADLDGDGDLDVAVATNNNWVSILKNNGNGTFAPFVPYTSVNGARGIALGDVDGDGDQDIAAASGTFGLVYVLKNNVNGTFAAPVSYSAGSDVSAVTIADLDGDSHLDLAVTNGSSTHTVSVLLNNGDGTFAARAPFGVGSIPASIVAGDLDGDGDMDIATANGGSPDTISVLLNNGDATFAPHVTYATPNDPAAIACADLDGDADLDLTTANTSNNNVAVFLNLGGGTFAPQQSFAVGSAPSSVALADLDGNASPDLAATNLTNGPGGNSVSVLINLTDVLPPGPFSLSAPLTGLTNFMPTEPTFRCQWSRPSGFQVAFTLRFATEPTFAAPVLEVPGLSDIHHSPAASILLPNTRYYWQVTATNPVGAVPAMNGPFTFVTPLAGDADDNGVVNFADITSTLANFGAEP